MKTKTIGNNNENENGNDQIMNGKKKDCGGWKCSRIRSRSRRSSVPMESMIHALKSWPFTFLRSMSGSMLFCVSRIAVSVTLWSRVVLLLFILSTSISQAAVEIGSSQASFFGSSHVSVRLQEARSSSDIYFRIRTRRADSMLFLAAGRTDYCLLVLDAGRLKVHINLGAGETEIASEAPFLLNDMKWHAVNLTRRAAQLTIQVDSHLTKANLPVKFHELNIHFGIWLGGLAGFNEIFLGNLPSFRGCMSHITYNNEDVLLKAKTQPGQIHGVTWNCSSEFEALNEDPFSLVGPSSYVITRVAISRAGTIISLHLRPSLIEGLIFYVSGMSSRPDYLALELRQGKPRLVTEMGSGPVTVDSKLNITDNQWHSISIQVSPLILSLRVDNESLSGESGGRGASRHLDVSELFYLGVEETKKSRLRSQGLIERSFTGCIRDLVIDAKPYGLPQVDVSSNITTGCLLLDENERATCRISGADENCNEISGENISNSSTSGTGKSRISQGNSGSRNVTSPGRSGSSGTGTGTAGARDEMRIVTQTALGELEMMRVSPVQVAEGDSVIVTPRHLAITLDLTKFGVRESGVLFRVSKAPQQGRLEVTARTAGAGSSRTTETFSLLDVGAGRVRYWHNGAEGSRDAIELVLKLVPTSGFILPEYLQDERTITLPVEVTGVNDPPEIRLVPGGVLRLAQGTKMRLVPEVISSLDPDTRPQDLHFSIISLGTGGERKGYLELSSDPGKAIDTFTQQDLQDGRVWYVDGGLSSSKMALKVTDGSSVSQTALLRIETFPLRIAPETNSGLEVANVMGTSVLLSSSNLSFTSNAGDQGLVVEYHVVGGPRAGQLQLRRTNGQWTNTDHFTQADLNSGRLRYLLQRPSDIPTEDEFTFHVSLSEVKLPSEFRFRLRVVPVRLEQSGSNQLTLNGTREGNFNSRVLDYRTLPTSTADPAITYTLVQPPRFGFLRFRQSHNSPLMASRGGGGSSSSSRNDANQKQSESGETPDSNLVYFTQSDIGNKRIMYKFKWVPYSAMSDFFLFNVSTSQLTSSSGPFRCDILHVPSPSSRPPIQAILSPLLVKEGGREALSKKVIRIILTNPSGAGQLLSELHFNVTEPPLYGTVQRDRDPSSSPSSYLSLPSPHASTFTWKDIERAEIFYRHDGSETARDKMQLMAWSATGNLMFVTEIDIMVEGLNNHPPHPQPGASLSLNVVTGGVKKLSVDVLDYVDEDWDSDRGMLKYSTRGSAGLSGISMGNVFDRTASLARPIFQWTQADIDAGKLIFKHEGADSNGILPFWVQDTTFSVNGTLKISAGAPWVRIVNTSRLAAKRGASARLSQHSIRVETNVDVDEPRIFVRILQNPQNGVITVNETEAKSFTLGDMSRGVVAYRSDGASAVERDSFTFQAAVQAITESAQGELEVAIYPEAYWTPLNVGANGSVTVKENSSAVIWPSSLHITNPHIPPSDILFTLTKPPRHGYLAVDPASQSLQDGRLEDGADYVTMWDQTAINAGRLRYIQSEPNKTHDSMHFDVTNGVQSLRNLRLDFIVVPTHLLLASASVTVSEGNSIALNITHLHAAQNYFADKLWEVQIISSPSHGTLSMISRPKTPLQTFPYKALQDGKIFYTHDGSETLSDQFTVLASTGKSSSSSNTGGSGSGSGSGGTKKEKASAGEKGVDGSENRISQPHVIAIKIIPANDQIPRVVNNTGSWVWAGASVPITSSELAGTDADSDASDLVFYVVGTRGGYPAVVDKLDVPLSNFTQTMINTSQIIFVHKGLDLSRSWFEFELSDGLNEAAKEQFNVSVKKPVLLVYEGRVRLAVFPLTQTQFKPENLLVRSSDGREITFQTQTGGGPGLGQILIERGENNFSPVSTFTQTDVNNGKIFYQHTNEFRGHKGNDTIRFTATSRYADPLDNVTLEIDVSVSGAALGGLQRYVSILPLLLKEGGQVALTNENLNFSALTDFIQIHHRGNMWRSAEMPTLRLLLHSTPKNGGLFVGEKQTGSGSGTGFGPGIITGTGLGPRTGLCRSIRTDCLQDGAEISLSQLQRRMLFYEHDDTETTADSIEFSLFLLTVTGGGGGGGGGGSVGGTKEKVGSSTWLVNVTLPVHITPVNDQPFHITKSKAPVLSVVQEHWRKLNRNDLHTSDPDTPPAHILYQVTNISHGRLLLTTNNNNDSSDQQQQQQQQNQIQDFKLLPSASRFTQADIDAGKVVLYHSGALSPININLKVSDGHFLPMMLSLSVPVERITLQSSQSQAAPVLIQQGNNLMTLSPMHLPSSTNGHPSRLVYNVTRFPLHGKVLLHHRISTPSTFSHMELLRGDVAYLQTDLSVSNDSFEVKAAFPDIFKSSMSPLSTSWLVNIVAVPLLKRVKEVRAFIKGFAVGGILAPDESEFSASMTYGTTLSLAVLDASPLAAVTGANPFYEILLPPKFGVLYKIPFSENRNLIGGGQFSLGGGAGAGVGAGSGSGARGSGMVQINKVGRLANRFSHEDVRRGSIVYSPSHVDLGSNEIIPFPYTASLVTSSASAASSSQLVSGSRGGRAGAPGMADEFIFKVLAPGVQPALGIAKFNVRDEADEKNRFYDEKTHNQIISDGSTDSATKRISGRGGSGLGGSSIKDITFLVTPHVTKDSLITVAVVVGGIVTFTLLLIVGIRCSCSKSTSRNEVGRRNVGGVGGLNNGCHPADPKCISNGIIDAYAPSNLDPCHTDSDGGGGNNANVMRPLMMSMSTLSPRQSRHCGHLSHKMGVGGSNRSDSGSWTSCSVSAGGGMPTPSIPQCRVTPLCAPPTSSTGGGSSDSGGGGGGGGGGYGGGLSNSNSNSLLMCPLLPPTPICDTFAPLPEEVDPPEPYGFTYGSITKTLLPPPLDIRDVMVEETPFNESQFNLDNHPLREHHHNHNHPHSYGEHHTGTLPNYSHSHHQPPHSHMGTLRSTTMERHKRSQQQQQQQQQPGGQGQGQNNGQSRDGQCQTKNQYWV